MKRIRAAGLWRARARQKGARPRAPTCAVCCAAVHGRRRTGAASAARFAAGLQPHDYHLQQVHAGNGTSAAAARAPEHQPAPAGRLPKTRALTQLFLASSPKRVSRILPAEQGQPLSPASRPSACPHARRPPPPPRLRQPRCRSRNLSLLPKSA